MNTGRRLRSIVYMLILLAALPGCKKDKKIITKISSDGSCVRTVAVTPPSDTSASFPIPMDHSWDFRVEGDTEKTYVASKRFENVNQLNDEYRRSGKIGTEIKFEKKFRWFFTYFQYQETYKACFPFKKLSAQSFFTREELAHFQRKDTTKTMKRRIEEFINAAVFEEFYCQLIDSVEQLHDPSLPVSIFQEKKTTFTMDQLEHNPDGIARNLEQALHVTFSSTLKRQIGEIDKSIEDKIKYMIDAEGNYINEVQMPGIILSTNADAVEGNKVLWNFTEDQFELLDFTMTVESRVANVWTTYVSGGVLIAMVVLLLLPRMKRK
jgi:hypothetical protein